MLKKSLASLIVAALLSTIPGPAFASAAAGAAGRAASAARPTLAPAIGTLSLPASPLVRPALATPLTTSKIQMPSVQAPAAADARYAAPVAAAVNSEAVAKVVDSAAAGDASKASEGLGAAYDGAVEGGIETEASEPVIRSLPGSDVVIRLRPGRYMTPRAGRSVPSSKNGGLIVEAGALALVAAVIGSIVSPAFRAQMVRLGGTIRAWIGLGVSRTKTPAVLAEEIRQDYEQKLAEQDKIVELAAVREAQLDGQIDQLVAKAEQLLKDIDDVINDSVKENDDDAPIEEREAVLADITARQASLARTKEQVTAAIERKKSLEREYKDAKAAMRATLSKIEQDQWDAAQAKLNASISSSTGDLGKKKEEFEQAANDASAQAKGETKAAGASTDETIRKARAEREKRERAEKIEKIKQELLAKKNGGQNGGAIGRAASFGDHPLFAIAAGAAVVLILGLILGPTLTWNAGIFGPTLVAAVLLGKRAWDKSRGVAFDDKRISSSFSYMTVGMGVAALPMAVASLISPWVLLFPSAYAGITLLFARLSVNEKNLAAASKSDLSNGGLLAEAGALALVAAVAAGIGSIVSPAFRAQMVRLGGTIRAWIGLGVSRTKTPAVLAEEIRQDYEQKLAEQDKIVELAAVREAQLDGQIDQLVAKAEQLLKDIDDVINDSVKENDDDAPIEEREAVLADITARQASLARTKEQVTEAIERKKSLEREYKDAKAAMRATLSKIEQDQWDAAQAKLNASISSSTGDLGKKKEEFEQAANDASAQAKGETKAAGASTDETIRKARAEREKRERAEKIEKIKQELLAKKDGGNGGKMEGGPGARRREELRRAYEASVAATAAAAARAQRIKKLEKELLGKKDARNGGKIEGARGVLPGLAFLGGTAAFLATFNEIIGGSSMESGLIALFFWIAAGPSFVIGAGAGFLWKAAQNASAREAGKVALQVGAAALAIGPALALLFTSL